LHAKGKAVRVAGAESAKPRRASRGLRRLSPGHPSAAMGQGRRPHHYFVLSSLPAFPSLTVTWKVTSWLNPPPEAFTFATLLAALASLSALRVMSALVLPFSIFVFAGSAVTPAGRSVISMSTGSSNFSRAILTVTLAVSPALTSVSGGAVTVSFL